MFHVKHLFREGILRWGARGQRRSGRVLGGSGVAHANARRFACGRASPPDAHGERLTTRRPHARLRAAGAPHGLWAPDVGAAHARSRAAYRCTPADASAPAGSAPPVTVQATPATALATASASSHGAPAARAAASAPTWASPAPTVSTTSTGSVGALITAPSARYAAAPWTPHVITHAFSHAVAIVRPASSTVAAPVNSSAS